MLPVIGKDKNGGVWFKSDQYVTNISKASEFYVRHRWFGLGSYSLIAVFPFTKHQYICGEGYVDKTYHQYKEIGRFKTALEASFGMEEAMRLKGINVVS